jgi:hypothetical protein
VTRADRDLARLLTAHRAGAATPLEQMALAEFIGRLADRSDTRRVSLRPRGRPAKASKSAVQGGWIYAFALASIRANWDMATEQISAWPEIAALLRDRLPDDSPESLAEKYAFGAVSRQTATRYLAEAGKSPKIK